MLRLRKVFSRTARRRLWAGIAAAVIVFLSARFIGVAKTPAPKGASGEITIDAIGFALDPADRERIDFGKLEWRSGVILRSSAPEFGGYSGLSIDRTGKRLTAISDKGTWLSASLEYRNGRIAALGDAHTGPLKIGTPHKGKAYRDAESLAPLKWGQIDGRYLIGFEHRHRIVPYRVAKGRFGSPQRPLKLVQSALNLPDNKGLEGVEVLAGGPHKGAVVAFAEEQTDGKGYILGWLIERGRIASFCLKRLDEFDVTGLAALPDGSLLVLERKFKGIFSGIFMRVRRIAAKQIRPGARVTGEILFTSKRGHFVDNMEGITVHRDASGELIVTIISDDNFNPIQRTLLMQFALK